MVDSASAARTLCSIPKMLTAGRATAAARRVSPRPGPISTSIGRSFPKTARQATGVSPPSRAPVAGQAPGAVTALTRAAATRLVDAVVAREGEMFHAVRVGVDDDPHAGRDGLADVLGAQIEPLRIG